MRGLFITFEGIDGCGKSTQMSFLGETLRGRGFDVCLTREPGGCAVSEILRDLVLDPKYPEMNPHTEALLYAASRVQHAAQVIEPALSAGKIVLCDRFFDSSLAYQGGGRQIGEPVADYNYYAITNFAPNLTFFLDFPPEACFARMSESKQLDRLEQSGEEFFHRVYSTYMELIKENPNRIACIDVSGSKLETREKIAAIALPVIEKYYGR